MKIKGEIGEEVYVKANIEEIRISQKGITYEVVRHSPITESDIVFLKDDDEEIEEKEEKRRPGRPRKATVGDLMKKCESIRDKKGAGNEGADHTGD